MAQSISNTIKIGCSIQDSIVIAHGTGTFQNRSTESDVLNRVAEGFELKNWKVTALKGMLGHTMGPAAGDELMTAIGIWNHGLIPGINTTKKLADDVLSDNLDFCLNTREVDKEKIDTIYLNSKGLAGNNGNIFDTANIFGYLAIVLAAVNIFGGFLVTQRMLAMYKKKKKDK